ncbi:MAG: 1-deoxy-D-xylulose-5-phosphate synthase [Bacteroidales bacterium]|jgi:1-deoxy-D-xylulose-5-phosphate synthase|nr:1-deoxy-D-xylulose-5-phosphate synthase [Bacteroidales bacterium]
MSYKFLYKINSPADLRQQKLADLPEVCDELRRFIIESEAVNPAHFGANLGVIELTVALHYVFDVPKDNLIWDVGHQAYGHKILTGRRDSFKTNRKYKGISGFPSPAESEYDSFGVGHSSTSISAALGMAVAAKMNGSNERTIAVIGDGALSGGEAFEALNNAAVCKPNLLIILNDNKIAIDETPGALREYLTDISTSKTYNKVKDDVWHFLGKVNKLGPDVRHFTQRIDNAVKSIVMKQSNLFESMNIRYFGPVDGHDVLSLVKLFEDLKNINGPLLLHLITQKGKGFKPAEENPREWHAAPGKFEVETGKLIANEEDHKTPQKYQDIFGEAILQLASDNEKIVAISPAMVSGSGLLKMFEKYPERSFDVGISEQHAVTFAAGLAIKGMIPYCCIYSTFAQRAFDQIVHDVALQNLHVVMCLDRAGLVGADGATHHGAFDISVLRCIPNLVVSAPSDEYQLRNLLYTAQLEKNNFPFVIRYPRGKSVFPKSEIEFSEMEIGKGKCVREGDDVAIMSIGTTGQTAIKVADKLKSDDNVVVSVYDMIFVKPVDETMLRDACQKHKYIVTIEDNAIACGFGSEVLEFVSDNEYDVKVKRFGIPDYFVAHGTQEELIHECGYDADSVYGWIKKRLFS